MKFNLPPSSSNQCYLDLRMRVCSIKSTVIISEGPVRCSITCKHINKIALNNISECTMGDCVVFNIKMNRVGVIVHHDVDGV